MRKALVGHVGHNGLSASICEEFRYAAEDTTMPREASISLGLRRASSRQWYLGFSASAIALYAVFGFKTLNLLSFPRTAWAKRDVLLTSASERFAYTKLPKNCAGRAGVPVLLLVVEQTLRYVTCTNPLP